MGIILEISEMDQWEMKNSFGIRILILSFLVQFLFEESVFSIGRVDILNNLILKDNFRGIKII
jgi:hypothetical protein